jgi:hypothetical protein
MSWISEVRHPPVPLHVEGNFLEKCSGSQILHTSSWCLGLGIQMLKLNNDVVNTVSKSAFTTQDSRNQTTLTSAMFQQKRRVTSAITTNEPSTTAPERDTTSPGADTPQADDGSGSRDERLTTMEIDRETFRELPPEIQEELAHQHRLVFVDRREQPEPSPQGSNDHSIVQSRFTGDNPFQADHAELLTLSAPVIRDTLQNHAGNRHVASGHAESLLNDNDQSVGCGILPSPSQVSLVLCWSGKDLRPSINVVFFYLTRPCSWIDRCYRPYLRRSEQKSSKSIPISKKIMN